MSGLSTQGNRVRELRENKLMTQAQLARKARVALRTIHSVEKGMNCRMDTKRKILLALGLRFEDKDIVFPPMKRSILPEMPTH
ncbi:MAG: helix-turn-helix transcriptional regulator [Myxococcota bacterium]|nr:helix-turn-helix transcriptional regulator [Myxococcota bacterium]